MSRTFAQLGQFIVQVSKRSVRLVSGDVIRARKRATGDYYGEVFNAVVLLLGGRKDIHLKMDDTEKRFWRVTALERIIKSLNMNDTELYALASRVDFMYYNPKYRKLVD